MCQLIFVNAGATDLNRMLSFQLSKFDSEFTNRDGFGIFTKGGIWKSVTEPAKIPNVGIILREKIKNPGPVLLHVRAASKGIAVEEKNVHPFESKDFVLAHNGTLFDKDEVTTWDETKDESRPSDSLMFLNELQNQYTKKKGVVEALKEAMALFKGKFAFLIFCKKDNTYYAVRGRTADLHIAYISAVTPEGELSPLGYVINTLETTLEKALSEVCHLYELGTGRTLFYEIKELEKETIYQCNDTDVVEIGKITEVSAWGATNFIGAGVAATKNIMTRVRDQSSRSFPIVNTPQHGDSTRELSLFGDRVQKIRRIAYQNCINLADVEKILTVTLGVALSDMEETDVEILANEVFPRLIPQGRVNKFIENKKGIPHLDLQFFEDNNLQWPLGANRNMNAKTLLKLVAQYFETKERAYD